MENIVPNRMGNIERLEYQSQVVSWDSLDILDYSIDDILGNPENKIQEDVDIDSGTESIEDTEADLIELFVGHEKIGLSDLTSRKKMIAILEEMIRSEEGLTDIEFEEFMQELDNRIIKIAD